VRRDGCAEAFRPPFRRNVVTHSEAFRPPPD
jgi:hypothetical protein